MFDGQHWIKPMTSRNHNVMAGQRILVTGANGFIGRRLCARLQADNACVRAILRTASNGPWEEAVIADLGKSPLAEGCMDGIDTVFHLASKVHAVDEVETDVAAYQAVNVDGTARLLDAAGAGNVRQFILFSSVKAAGEGDDIVLDEASPASPTTVYGRSKLQAEQLVLKSPGIAKVVVIRPAMVYGPKNPGNLCRMIAAIRTGFFPPWPRIENRRSMIHVDDVIETAMLVSRKPQAAGQVFFVTDGRYYSTRQIYEWICAAVDAPVRRWSIPMSLLSGLALIGDGASAISGRNMPFNSDVLSKLAGSSAYDSAKIRDMLGFEPKWTLETALADIVCSMK